MFSSGERDVLRELGLTVLTENEVSEGEVSSYTSRYTVWRTNTKNNSIVSHCIVQEGKRLVTKPTLFYLMHCGKALYNNLLWKNWNAQCLPLMIIIGNSFNGMMDRLVQDMNQRDDVKEIRGEVR